MYENNIDPYSGDVVHETPFMLILYYLLVKYAKTLIPLIHIAVDLFTAILLYGAAKNITRKFVS